MWANEMRADTVARNTGVIRSGLCRFTLAATKKINYDGARVLSARVCSVSARPELISSSAREREMDLPWLVSGSAGTGALAGWRPYRLQCCTADKICIAQMKKEAGELMARICSQDNRQDVARLGGKKCRLVMGDA